MQLLIARAALAAAFVLATALAGRAPALGQDFSITNQLDPADAAQRDLMRQLQAWWDAHAYYPRRASDNDEAGTAKVHLVIHSDGVIWMSNTVEGSGSRALDAAAAAAFQGGFVRLFPTNVAGTAVQAAGRYQLVGLAASIASDSAELDFSCNGSTAHLL